jgi:tetratricopeptide (TPR) repeat protein
MIMITRTLRNLAGALRPARARPQRHAAVLAFGLFAAALLGGRPAHAAWDFEPTALEWQSWPLYCRVQYSWVNAGFEFQYGGTIPNDVVDDWRRTIGDYTFTGMHHWCASIHFLNRARVETAPLMRDFVLRRAWEDAMFSFSRAETQSPVFPNMAVTVAQIRQEMGKPDEAEAALKRSIDAQPSRAEPYVMLAMIKRKAKKLPEALAVMKQADDVAHGQSAEIQYNLGLINLEIGDKDAAVANAKKAYGLGYPLPGLKNKLRKLGRWSDADDAEAEAKAAAPKPAEVASPPPAAAVSAAPAPAAR